MLGEPRFELGGQRAATMDLAGGRINHGAFAARRLTGVDDRADGVGDRRRKRVDAATEAVRRRPASADDDGRPVGAPVTEPVGEDGDSMRAECPNCGTETAAALDFCHWCTEPLPWNDGEANGSA